MLYFIIFTCFFFKCLFCVYILTMRKGPHSMVITLVPYLFPKNVDKKTCTHVTHRKQIKNASISHESSGILQLKPSDVAYDAVP